MKVFEPIGKYSGKDSEMLLHDFELFEWLAKENNIDFDLSKLKEVVENKFTEHNKKLKEVIEYLSNFYGKFVNMKFYYNNNYGPTRETEPNWVCDYNINALLYRYVPDNDSLFGIINMLHSEYEGGVCDKSIHIGEFMESHRLEIEEITKEDFVTTAKESLEKCLSKRINKIESGNYELTKNGYIFKKQRKKPQDDNVLRL